MPKVFAGLRKFQWVNWFMFSNVLKTNTGQPGEDHSLGARDLQVYFKYSVLRGPIDARARALLPSLRVDQTVPAVDVQLNCHGGFFFESAPRGSAPLALVPNNEQELAAARTPLQGYPDRGTLNFGNHPLTTGCQLPSSHLHQSQYRLLWTTSKVSTAISRRRTQTRSESFRC